MLKYVNYSVVFQEIPDEVTLAINISNCPHHCKGCHSDYLMQDIGNILTTESLDELVVPYLHDITCICFMGGDADPTGIDSLVKWLKNRYPDIKRAWYSGKESLPANFDMTSFEYVKVGPYIEGFGPLNSKTTNQRLYKIVDNQMIDITSRFWKK